ncbi:MAG: hypothetical protein PUK79_08350 [Clostridiales bacterium]|nr:hypothetical protein [Clostridiales bacterium]MDY2834516.1 hypothetical protein [Candidatus Aphodomonas sp.]
MTKLRIHLSIAISIQKQPPGQPAQNLRELGGIGTAEKHWSTVTFNGHDKKANLRLDEVKFSSSESINSICNMEAAVWMGGVKSEGVGRHGRCRKTLEYHCIQRL